MTKKKSLEEIMVEGSTYNRCHLKKRLIEEGIFKNECYKCGMGSTWQGAPIKHILDHINGVNNDHRLKNLRMVCPNCDSQSEFYCGKNSKIKAKVWKCTDCGVKVSKQRYFCRKCGCVRRSKRQETFKIRWPATEKLIELTKRLGFSAAGRELGVSDNAIRKRIRTRSK